MSPAVATMRFLLDESVPASVGAALRDAGHTIVSWRDSDIQKGVVDPLVCAAAEANDAVRVALDGDMKQLARDRGVGQSRFRRMSLLHLQCRESQATTRVSGALSLIEHEWRHASQAGGRRLFVVVGQSMIRTNR